MTMNSKQYEVILGNNDDAIVSTLHLENVEVGETVREIYRLSKTLGRVRATLTDQLKVDRKEDAPRVVKLYELSDKKRKNDVVSAKSTVKHALKRTTIKVNDFNALLRIPNKHIREKEVYLSYAYTTMKGYTATVNEWSPEEIQDLKNLWMMRDMSQKPYKNVREIADCLDRSVASVAHKLEYEYNRENQNPQGTYNKLNDITF